MVELQEYHLLGQSSGPYPYNEVASGARIEFVQVLTTYHVATGEITYHNFEKEIQTCKDAHLLPRTTGTPTFRP